MLRRNLLHMVRYPGLSMFIIGGPVVFLLLFVFVFGGTLGAGLPGVDPAGGREAYLAYVMPGILLITIAGTAGGTATTVAMDMTEGITARFRTMAISRAAVLAGHVLGNTIQAIIAVVARARRRPADRVPPDRRTDRVARRRRPARAHLVRDQLARGRHGDAVEVGRDGQQPAAPADLPALPRQRLRADRLDAGWLQWFAQYQPFTPFIETIRGLLLGTPLGWNPVLAIGWCVVIAVAGYAWSMTIYERKSVR